MNPCEHLVYELRLLAFATDASRRVGKAGYLAKRENPRFVVTSLTAEQCANRYMNKRIAPAARWKIGSRNSNYFSLPPEPVR